MKAIIIGAGRGRRLMPSTADAPKCFAEVAGRRILDWARHALAENGVSRICFIGGYRIEQVRAAYPRFEFFHNDDWENNNILASLMCAEEAMDEPFLCSYSDILYTPEVIRRVLAAPGDAVLAVDTDWRRRYAGRTRHPSADAEKVSARNGLVTRIHRDIPDEQAHGEFIGVAKFSTPGAERLRARYRRCRKRCAGGPFREAREFKKAYLIQLFQEMIEAGEKITHADTHGEYLEIDTQEDFDQARRIWR